MRSKGGNCLDLPDRSDTLPFPPFPPRDGLP